MKRGANMNKLLIAYGLTKPQFAHLQAALPEEYELIIAACVTDLIVRNAVCVVINAANMCQDALRVLLLYYMDMGNRLDGTIVWLGRTKVPDLPSFVRCDSFLDMMTELKSILSGAQGRYNATRTSNGTVCLPTHAIEESVEADISTALHSKYGMNPDKRLVKRVHREYWAVLEAGAAEELAAVAALTRWLKTNKYPFSVECSTAFPLILYLLSITDSSPQIDLDQNPLLQKSRWNPKFVFSLSKGFQTRIIQWKEHYWLCSRIRNPSAAFERITFVFHEIGT